MHYTPVQIYNLIEELSIKEGFVEFGIADVKELLPDKLRYIAAMESNHFANMHYLYKNLEKRFNPSLLVDGAKSVLVFLAPYSPPTELKETPKGIAQYAWGEDYHKIIKDKLHNIIKSINNLFPNNIISARPFTDSAPILERSWGVKAGLGFIGRNNFLISPKSGIKNFIGIIITSLQLPQSIDIYKERRRFLNGDNLCGKCKRCLEACPSGALCKAYTLDSNKCLSYQTIENRDVLLEVNNIKFNGWYFGCDNCLNVCPWNGKNREGWRDFYKFANSLYKMESDKYASLNAENFKSTFSNSPISRTDFKRFITLYKKRDE